MKDLRQMLHEDLPSLSLWLADRQVIFQGEVDFRQMFIRFRKSGISGIITKSAHWGLMTGTVRETVFSLASKMMCFPVYSEGKSRLVTSQDVKENLACSLGAIKPQTILMATKPSMLVCSSNFVDEINDAAFEQCILKCHATSLRQ